MSAHVYVVHVASDRSALLRLCVFVCVCVCVWVCVCACEFDIYVLKSLRTLLHFLERSIIVCLHTFMYEHKAEPAFRIYIKVYVPVCVCVCVMVSLISLEGQ